MSIGWVPFALLLIWWPSQAACFSCAATRVSESTESWRLGSACGLPSTHSGADVYRGTYTG